MKRTKAVLLLSGGIDSATCLAIAHAMNREIFALSFDYGQRHRVEIRRARALARRYGCADFRVVKVDLPGRGISALTSRRLEIPKRGLRKKAIPVTYVPARNSIFLAHALSWAEAVTASEIWIGANVIDYSGYPDCRPAFLRAFERMANLGTRSGVTGRQKFKVLAPLLKMTKTEILLTGLWLGVDYSRTISCYDPSRAGMPCGKCDSCRIRQEAFGNIG